MAVVLTIGTFDLFHSGHVDLLLRCKRLAGPAGKVIVGLNTDEFVEGYKGAPPVIRYHDRERVLTSNKNVFDVVKNDQEDGSIKGLLGDLEGWSYHPDILAVGEDWAGPSKDYHAQIGVDRSELLALHGVSLVFLPRPAGGISTTEIKRRLMGSAAPAPLIINHPPTLYGRGE